MNESSERKAPVANTVGEWSKKQRGKEHLSGIVTTSDINNII